MAESEVPLTTTITAVVTALAEATRVKIRRVLRTLMLTVMRFILLTTAAMTLLIVGITRLGEALTQVCSRWFTDPLVGDLVVGFTFVVLPVVGMLVLRRRHSAEKK